MKKEGEKSLVEVNLNVPKEWKAPLKFLFNIIGNPLAETSGMISDWLKYRRFKNLVSISEKLKELNISKSEVQTAQSFLSTNQNLKLIEFSSLADDDFLQNKWANLIANAASGVNFHNLYSELLNSLEPIDAKILDRLVNNKNPDGFKSLDIVALMDVKPASIRLSLANLERLGLIVFGNPLYSGGKLSGVLPAKESDSTRYLVSDLGIQLKNICEKK